MVCSFGFLWCKSSADGWGKLMLCPCSRTLCCTLTQWMLTVGASLPLAGCFNHHSPPVIFSKPLYAWEITTTTFSVATGEPLLQAVMYWMGCLQVVVSFSIFENIYYINPSVAPGWAIQHLINVLKWWSGLETKSLEMKRNKWAYRTSVVLSWSLLGAIIT